MSDGSKAVAILVDNSATAMDGDFYPNRLRAQLETVVRYSQYLLSSAPASQIAFGTIGSSEFGIRASFTGNLQKIENSLRSITSGGGIELVRGLKCAVLALHHCKANQTTLKRIMAFVGFENDLNEVNRRQIAKLLVRENVGLDLFAIGDNVPNVNELKMLVKELNARSKTIRSNLMLIPKSETILSDNVISSLIECSSQMVKMNEVADVMVNKHPQKRAASVFSSVVKMLADQKVTTKRNAQASAVTRTKRNLQQNERNLQMTQIISTNMNSKAAPHSELRNNNPQNIPPHALQYMYFPNNMNTSHKIIINPALNNNNLQMNPQQPNLFTDAANPEQINSKSKNNPKEKNKKSQNLKILELFNPDNNENSNPTAHPITKGNTRGGKQGKGRGQRGQK